MIGYAICKMGRGGDYEQYTHVYSTIILNKEKAERILHIMQMTKELHSFLSDKEKYKRKCCFNQNIDSFIEEVKQDLPDLLSAGPAVPKPKFVGDPSNKEDNQIHLVKINEWKNTPWYRKKEELKQYNKLFEFYSNGGQFDWNIFHLIIRTEYNSEISFHIREFDIVE
jgi:hypothetical protein